MGSLTSPKTARHHISPCMARGFTYTPGYMLTPGQPSPGLSYPPASPHRSPTTPSGPTLPTQQARRPEEWFGWSASEDSALAHTSGYGNINPLSIDYACRPRLRSRLTLGGLACPRNPWSSGGRVSHSPFATHACILTPTTSTTRSLGGFTGRRTLPYPPQPNDWNATASAVCLSPATLSARNHLTSELLRTLSRMAASKPTSWLSRQLHILYHLAHA
jgi:hypothetical protein